MSASAGRLLDEIGPFRDKAGFPVVREGDSWRVHSLAARTGFLFDFSILDDMDLNDAEAFLAYIRHRIMTASASHARNCFVKLRSYVTSSDYRNADEALIAINAWKRTLRASGQEYNLHYVRDWYLWANDQDLDGFDDADLRWSLRQLKIPGNVKGIAVLREDPNEGPLFDVEEVALKGALQKDSRLTSEEVLLVWLFVSHGPNPMNVALLREEDFRKREALGQTFYELNIPRIKKRCRHRLEFRTRRLDPFLGQLIEEQIARNRANYPRRGGPRPLFWASTTRPRARHWSEFANHLSAREISIKLTEALDQLKVISPVTGFRLHVTPRRLRYSFACRLVQQGASVEELVDLLDHTDDQNVLVYFKNRAAQRKIDKATAVQFGPIADRFMGRVVKDEVEAGGDPSNRIKTYNLLDLGTCDLGAACDKYPPRACYLCPKFLAWKDAPHERFLAETIAVNRTDPRGSVQLDDVVLAIGQVVAACKR
ncbi:MAG TPA: hypothetical protein VMB26_01580 [Candidatus Binataceae bacterium]|nr:hypothetical protein [Candidatus Binataceae bacterium]